MTTAWTPHLRKDAPFAKDVDHLMFTTLSGDGEHPLLAFAQHQFVRAHVGFAHRDPIEIDLHPDVPFGRHLDRAAGQSGRTHVLDRDDGTGGESLKGRLDQQLLRERVADLHVRPLRVAVLPQGLTRERGAMDAVLARRRAEVDHGVADPFGFGRGDLLEANEADTHRIDERIAAVARVEGDLARHGGHAHAIAVSGDARDDMLEQVAVPCDHLVGLAAVGVRVAPDRPEPQGVQRGDRARTHREDVADNPPDSGGRALIWLDRRRMVVRLDLHRDAEPVADRHDAGVLESGTFERFAISLEVRKHGT